MAGSEESNSKTLLIGGLLAILAFAGWFFFRGTSEALVSGILTLDAVATSGVQVVFLDEDEARQSPFIAQTNEKGSFTVFGSTGPGIPPGKYRILISKMALKDGTLPAGEELEMARQNGLLQNVLPKIYEDFPTTPLRAELHTGKNTVNLDLKKNP